MREIAHQMNQDLNNFKIKIGSFGFLWEKGMHKSLMRAMKFPGF